MTYLTTAYTDTTRIKRLSTTELVAELSALRSDLREAQATVAAGYPAAHGACQVLRAEIRVQEAALARRSRREAMAAYQALDDHPGEYS